MKDPLFRYRRYHACLQIPGIKKIPSILFSPVSRPLIELLAETIQREHIDRIV